MKRYIKTAQHVHISDIISYISCFVITDNVLNLNWSEIHSSDDISNEYDDEYYSTIPDDILIATPKEELSHIDNIYILDRIAKLDKSKLSRDQLNALKREYKKGYAIDESDCKYLIDLFKGCNRIRIAPNVKNIDFLSRYELSDKDILAVLHNLNVDDFVASTRSINYNYLGNNLIIAQPSVVIVQDDENIMIGAKLYIKLDIDEISGSCAVFISFHEEDPTRPIQLTRDEDE